MSSGSTWECVWLTAEPMNGCSVWQQWSLKSALWEGLGGKKKWLKVENIPREAAFQHSYCPTPKTRLCSHWSPNYPSSLRLGKSSALLMSVCPSLQHFQQRRGEILHRSGLKDSTVRPFRGRRRPALLDVLTCIIKQINNPEESYCLVQSRFSKEKKTEWESSTLI